MREESWTCSACGKWNTDAYYCTGCGTAEAAAGKGIGAGSGEQTKTCPACRPTIWADAIKCRYCGEFFVTCRRCGTEAPAGLYKCPSCGATLPTRTDAGDGAMGDIGSEGLVG